MKYSIITDASKWPKPTVNNIVTAMQSGECVGSIKIEFSYRDETVVDERDHIEIPLFLTEFEDFLRRVNSENSQHWEMCFAPFAHGLLQNGSLLISALGGDEFADRVYDVTSKEDLQRLRAQVAEDISRYGKLKMNPGVEGRIVTEWDFILTDIPKNFSDK